MEVSTWEISSLLADKESLTEEQFSQLVKELRHGALQRERFMEMLNEAVAGPDESPFSKDSVMAMKVAQGFYGLGMYEKAIEWLDKIGTGKQQCYLKALSFQSLGEHEKAVGQFEQAEQKGFDSFEIAVAVVETLRNSGDLEGAAEKLNRISRAGDIRAEYHYQLGRLNEANGLKEEAIDEYERAITLDSSHAKALFRVAYVCDLYDIEEKTVEYYRQCIETGDAPVSALLNLAVLYEEEENYYRALQCVKQVLTAWPNHKRARMFLKDIEASTTMYYDEDQERRIDRRNKVLEIPISDFELSVRSRNCLRKMSIRSLADLLKVTESELLAYKNFGETSLQEIKTVLSSKGLRLGQMLEDHNNDAKKVPDQEQDGTDENEVLQLPVTQLEMSVRSRKCLERLNIGSISDLTKCTEAELLGCKNFGMTSLSEIKNSLGRYGVSLRQLEE